MSEDHLQRRLAAILAADVVGYTRLMAADEAGTLERLKRLRAELFDPLTAAHGGRIFKTTGDGALVEFPSAVDAVRSAIAVQRALVGEDEEAGGIRLRIGISLGDVIVEGDDLYGNGINIAVRMETLAEAGGICVSGNVHEHVAGALDAGFEDLGPRTVKNLDRPIPCFRVLLDGGTGIAAPTQVTTTAATAKPSIAVLPFTNMSGDGEQEFLADGMSEDIITGLSRFGGLLVIARNSTFTYKGEAIDVRRVADDLNVRYVLEGSVRKSGRRVRVTAQLIEAESGNHLWAERYDRDLDDIFEVQDEVTAAIIAAIAPEIDQAEIDRARRQPTENLDAWGFYQRSLALNPSGEEADLTAAIQLLDRAIAMDPNFTDAVAMAAYARLRLVFFYPSDHSPAMVEDARTLLQTAMRQDRGNGNALLAKARLHHYLGERGAAVETCREAMAINPSASLVHHELAFMLARAGRHEDAQTVLDTADRLSPRDPRMSGRYMIRAIGCYELGRIEEAAAWALKAQRSENPRYWCDALLVAALYRLGRTEEMNTAIDALFARHPGFSVSGFEASFKGFPPSFLEALRQAGLPD